jgi:hypothetical protein
MIRHLTYEQIDKQQWDRCIEQSMNSLIYGYSWYIDSVAPRWEALVLNDYEAVMPLVWNRKMFMSYLYQPYFTQQLGVFYRTLSAKDKLADFIKALPQTYRFIDINLNEQNEFTHPDYTLRKRKNLVLDLNKPYTKLLKDYDSHCTRNLKKAKKVAHTMRPVSISAAITFYRKHKGEVTSDIGSSDYKRLEQLLKQAGQHEMLLTRGVYSDTDELLAAGVFLVHNQRLIYLLGNASPKGRDARAMFLLFDHIIQQFSEQPVLLDFEGSEVPGIARFFKGFGPEKKPYFNLRINRLPLLVRWLK